MINLKRTIALILMLSAASSTLPMLAKAQTIIATIPVGVNPWCVDVNSNTNRIYVTNTHDDTVSVIDGSTNTVTATIPVGNVPIGVGVNSVTNRIYVTNEVDNTVSVIDGSTNTVTATIPVGDYPYAVGVNPDTNMIYVPNSHGDTVSVIDGSTNTVTATIPVGSGPWGVGVNSVTNRIYVAIYGGGAVSVIDGSTNIVTATIPAVGIALMAVGVNSVTNRIYVIDTSRDRASVIDGSTNTVTATIPVGDQPRGVGINPNTDRIYVTNWNGDTVSVILDEGGCSFELHLSAGWNMVSFPCLPDDPSFSNILSDVGYYQVLTWDGSSYVTPLIAEAGRGYWILVLTETTVTITDGVPVEGYELDLPAGWSMIGSILLCSVDVDCVFPDFYQLLTWDGTSYVTATTIEPGKGYWTLVLEPTHIIVDESCCTPF